MIRRVILNVAVGAWYPDGQQRLFDSLEEHGENATRLFWRDQYPPGSPSQQEALYGFKPYAFQAAREMGFDQALWLDASCWAFRIPTPLWHVLDEHGCYLEPDGHHVGNWISDRALEHFQLDRDEVMDMPLMEGKLIGLDFRDADACKFLDEWKAACDAGAFTGELTNDNGEVSGDPRCHGHRGDIPAGSIIADSLGLQVQEQKLVWFPSSGHPPDHVVFLAQGM